MKVYDVTIEETVCQSFKIQASSPEEAAYIAENKYRTEELIVDAGEMQDVKFLVGLSTDTKKCI